MCDLEQMVDQLIETGNSELIFEKAIQGQGRGQVRHTHACFDVFDELHCALSSLLQVVDTLAEIQERRDTMLELEKKLLDLQQVRSRDPKAMALEALMSRLSCVILSMVADVLGHVGAGGRPGRHAG